MERVVPDGKHLTLGGAPYRVKGVTYGTFAPRRDGCPFPEPARLEQDLVAIAACGFTALRTYTVPPPDLLDCARALDLRVLVGLDYPDWRMHAASWRSHREVRAAGRVAVRKALDIVAGRPEVLAVSVGNEIPVDIVRMVGRAAVEDHLSDLVGLVREGDPGMPATYTSFPTTEFLRVEGQDLCTFNVFLESAERLAPYLRHLQRISGDRPLVVTELGLASALHGEVRQADSLAMQLQLVEETGCAGATVFSWTDEWATPAGPVDGWGFGLTRTDRSPRPALDVAKSWAGRSLRDLRRTWPPVTAVVCAYNEEPRIGACLESLARVDYPALQVVVCDDGSTDRTLEIARRTSFEVLALPHAGLSVARNRGLAAATGEVVAYLDADAECHPEWPYHLALAFEDPQVLAAGGPNLPFPDAGLVERAVALSPGNPVEVLVGDDRAEHIPGCNMAVRRSALEQLGGFEPAYTAAGDDVDVCWRLLDLGGRIAFAPAAQVRHHRRATVRGYLRQQRGYGRAERMLMGQHRHRFNRLGAARWAGVVYDGPRILPRVLTPLVYHGPMGVAPFQSEVRDRSAAPAAWVSALLPVLVLAGLAALPLTVVHPAIGAVSGAVLLLVLGYAACVSISVELAPGESSPVRVRVLVGVLHVLQPFARTWGRLQGRPLPAREPASASWTGRREDWLQALERELASRWCRVRRAGAHDGWDLEVAVGPVLRCRLRTAVRWGWDPVARRTWALSSVAMVALAGAGAVGWLRPVAGVVLAGALVCSGIIEALLAARLCTAVVARTTQAARVGS
ncbi:MAG TPA: glycosyltransferase [Marmoricola sp.]